MKFQDQIFENFQVDLLAIARPLMKIFVQAELIRPLLKILCSDVIQKCQ